MAVGTRKAFLAAARDIDLDQRAAQDTVYRRAFNLKAPASIEGSYAAIGAGGCGGRSNDKPEIGARRSGGEVARPASLNIAPTSLHAAAPGKCRIAQDGS